jgi:NADH dehydrogenase
MAVISPLSAVADLRGWRVSGFVGWLLWGVAHLGFMPDNENRLSLLVKWLWSIGTQQRSSLLITGALNQHIAVDVGLERAPLPVEPDPAGDPEAITA